MLIFKRAEKCLFCFRHVGEEMSQNNLISIKLELREASDQTLEQACELTLFTRCQVCANEKISTFGGKADFVGPFGVILIQFVSTLYCTAIWMHYINTISPSLSVCNKSNSLEEFSQNMASFEPRFSLFTSDFLVHNPSGTLCNLFLHPVGTRTQMCTTRNLNSPVCPGIHGIQDHMLF